MDNCVSMDVKTAKGYLGYTTPSNGIMIQGCNGQRQFRPDNPKVIVKEDGTEKVLKYLTPREDEGYDAMFLTHPMYPNYWTNLDALEERAYKINGVPCIAITEGGFKAMVVMDNGIPCVSVLGVEMGLTPKKNDPQGKRYLVPALEEIS
jgi:putative DNA primase/helicase